MGLGLYVGGDQVAQWSYSGFNAFRRRLAKEIGINLDEMPGFSPDFKDILEEKGWEAYRNAKIAAMSNSKGKWEDVVDDIVPLLRHSDCEGIIPPEICATVGPRLAELIKDWPETVTFETDPFWQEKGYSKEMTLADHDTQQARSLVEGMRRAALEGLPLDFC